MKTLKTVYDQFRQALDTPAHEQPRAPVQSFDELLAQDTGPLYGISHDVYHLKHVWIPDCVRSGLHVLITGETGTGKEVVADCIHRLSERQRGARLPWVRLDCAALQSGQAEAELFGQGEGAITNLEAGYQGRLAQAAAGTLLLDEVGELEVAVQSRLLTVMQQGRYTPYGASRPVPLQARVVATSSRPASLPEALFWRFPEHMHIPPLRHRRLDVFFILHGLLSAADDAVEAAGREWLITPSTLLSLLFSPWQGNVGSLCNAIDMSRARYRQAPASVPRFFTCRLSSTDPDILNAPKAKYDLWRHLTRLVRESERGRELVPAEPPERTAIHDYGVLRSLGPEEMVPCFTCAEALEFATLLYEQLDEDSAAYACAEARVYTCDASRPPLPPLLRWCYTPQGDRRTDEERWAVDFRGMTAEQAYAAYLEGLRERCATMAEAVERSGLSDTTLRRHFKDHGIRQYKGKRPGK